MGVPVPSVEIKLVDVPEMAYEASRNGGEICIRGQSVFKGYLKDEKRTKEALDAEGWLHTGDVGVWTARGTLKIIDRKKHLLKLAQGEYVSPEKTETVYTQCPLVAQAFVYGDSLKSSLIGVVVAEVDMVRKAAVKANCAHVDDSTPPTQLCANADVKKLVLEAMTKLGKEKKLMAFEQVRTRPRCAHPIIPCR